MLNNLAKLHIHEVFLKYLIGLLRIELPKDVYERTGLLGQPIEDGGRKHQKTRFGERSPAI